MRMKVRALCAATAAAALLVAIPGNVGMTASARTAQGALAASQDRSPASVEVPRPRPPEEHEAYLRVAQEVPAFGGAYLDGDTVRVWLTRPSPEAARSARAALVRHVSSDFDVPNVSAQRADFTFKQLLAWDESLIDIHNVAKELVYQAASHRLNRVLIGSTNAERYRSAIEEKLDESRIPREAVKLEETEPIRMASSLRDSHRPVLGGLQIEFQTGVGGFFTAICTLGFVGINNSISGFVTNSHCSRTRSAVDNGRYWQPTRPLFDTGWIGHETQTSGSW